MKNRVKQVIARFMYLTYDPRKLRKFGFLPRYVSDLSKFKKRGGKFTHFDPIISDYNTSAGTITGDYFHQDLVVAQYIFKNNPDRHLDIGSRIDGFVAHVAAFRKIEVSDIRPLRSNVDNIKFVQSDITKLDKSLIDKYDSISSLHAIEHIGLGRYGDTVDPNGHLLAFKNIIAMTRPGGKIYLGLPFSKVTQIHFNASRIFSLVYILKEFIESNDLTLLCFDYVDDEGFLHHDRNIKQVSSLDIKYGCAILTLQK